MTMTLEKVAEQAPGLVSLAKEARVSLEKNGLAGERMAVYLVLDHSGSMQAHYRRGDVQRLTDQALGLAVNLDDDGVVPLIYFSSRASVPQDVSLSTYSGIVERTHHTTPWGSTDYLSAMQQVISHHAGTGGSGRREPALTIFQTDGNPNNRSAVEKALRDASHGPFFWSFVGFGGRVSFLQSLDDLGGRAVDNASVFHAARPEAVSDGDLYDGITGQVPAWLAAARRAGIVR